MESASCRHFASQTVEDESGCAGSSMIKKCRAYRAWQPVVFSLQSSTTTTSEPTFMKAESCTVARCRKTSTACGEENVLCKLREACIKDASDQAPETQRRMRGVACPKIVVLLGKVLHGLGQFMEQPPESLSRPRLHRDGGQGFGGLFSPSSRASSRKKSSLPLLASRSSSLSQRSSSIARTRWAI